MLSLQNDSMFFVTNSLMNKAKQPYFSSLLKAGTMIKKQLLLTHISS